ncbi:MAG: MarR family transcriptional regulator [Inquilinus sp.]|nr:MarR family transcriptional regulator [Inquilinus sp.]
MSIAGMSGDNSGSGQGGPPPAPPEGPCTCAQVRRAARGLTRDYDRALKPAGLKLTQYSVLANLVRAGGLTITELAERLAMDRTTLTRNLRPLERQGWIALAAGPDRRCRKVMATAKGRRRYEAALPLWREAERAFRSRMGEQEAAALHRLLGEALARP